MSAVEPSVPPLLTFFDDATGERIDLTAAALGGWASRTAAMLHDGHGLGAGSRAAVLLPPHWQTAAVLLGAWSAGVSVSFRPLATAGLTAVGPNEHEPFDVVFADRRQIDDWLVDVPAAKIGYALGAGPAADGFLDYLTEVRAFPDNLPAYASLRAGDPAMVDGTTYREWGSLARDMAERFDLRGGDRLLVDAAAHEHPVAWLLAPLSVGASVVVCANLDRSKLDRRVAEERVTRVL